MKCFKCGNMLPSDGKFCPYCGINFSTAEKPTASDAMRCSYCGSKIPVDSRFCPECGKKIDSVPFKNPQKPAKPLPTPEETEKLKKRNFVIGAGAVAAFGLIFSVALISSLIKPSINLNEYISIEYEGYDTVGKADVHFDLNKFAEKYEKKLASRVKDNTREMNDSQLAANYDGFSASKQFFSDCVDGSFLIEDGLKNGDTITYEWRCDDEAALNKYGYKLKYADIESTVSGLEEAELFDPFEGLNVTFEGISSKGKARIEGAPSEIEVTGQFQYKLSASSELSNGDEISLEAVSYYEDPVTFCIEQYGKCPTTLQKTITVEGLDTYITSLSEVTDTSLDELIRRGEETYQDKVISRYSDGITFQSMEYLGNYLLTNKDTSASIRNMLYLVYKININASTSNDRTSYDQDHDVYWYIGYNNVTTNNEKALHVDTTKYKVADNSLIINSGVVRNWFEKHWTVKGYKTLNAFYQDIITPNTKTYEVEENIAEIGGGNTEPDITESADQPPVVQDTTGHSEIGFIFPDSSDALIGTDRIEALTDEDLRLAINEIYARHGYIFKDTALKQHFNQFDWYRETVRPEDFSEEILNEIERKNIETLQAERDSRA